MHVNRHPQVQRVIKRQRSLANGELPGLASPERGGATAPHSLAHTPGSGVAAAPTDFLPRCMGVLHGLYDAASQMAPLFNLQVKDVFYKPVSATFPNIAADYYSRISHPMTWQMVEQRITGGVYASAQDFADVRSLRCAALQQQCRCVTHACICCHARAAFLQPALPLATMHANLKAYRGPTQAHAHTTHICPTGHAACCCQLQAVQPPAS